MRYQVPYKVDVSPWVRDRRILLYQSELGGQCNNSDETYMERNGCDRYRQLYSRRPVKCKWHYYPLGLKTQKKNNQNLLRSSKTKKMFQRKIINT